MEVITLQTSQALSCSPFPANDLSPDCMEGAATLEDDHLILPPPALRARLYPSPALRLSWRSQCPSSHLRPCPWALPPPSLLTQLLNSCSHPLSPVCFLPCLMAPSHQHLCMLYCLPSLKILPRDPRPLSSCYLLQSTPLHSCSSEELPQASLLILTTVLSLTYSREAIVLTTSKDHSFQGHWHSSCQIPWPVFCPHLL